MWMNEWMNDGATCKHHYVTWQWLLSWLLSKYREVLPHLTGSSVTLPGFPHYLQDCHLLSVHGFIRLLKVSPKHCLYDITSTLPLRRTNCWWAVTYLLDYLARLPVIALQVSDWCLQVGSIGWHSTSMATWLDCHFWTTRLKMIVSSTAWTSVKRSSTSLPSTPRTTR